MRIVFCVTAPEWGGNEKWALTTAAGLAGRGHDVAVLWSRGTVGKELARRGLKGRRAPFVSNWSPVGLASLAYHFLAFRPDAVVLTRRREYLVGGVAAGLAGRLDELAGRLTRLGSRLTGRSADLPVARRGPGRPLVVVRLGLRRRLRDDFSTRTAFGTLADLIIVNSLAIRDGLEQSKWLDPDKVRVLLNGVETSAASADAGRAALSDLGVAPEAPVVMAAGRLNRQKGFDVLIDAMAAVGREVPAARLVILGGGRRRGSLEEHASRAGVGGVVFAGHRGDVRDMLAAADVYALSSRNEGMANTLLEAMSVGAPIVATDVSGTREAVRDGIDALVVPPDDPDALAVAVLGVLRERELAARLGASAIKRARKLFGVGRMVTELEFMILEALGGRRYSAVASGSRGGPRPGLHSGGQRVADSRHEERNGEQK